MYVSSRNAPIQERLQTVSAEEHVHVGDLGLSTEFCVVYTHQQVELLGGTSPLWEFINHLKNAMKNAVTPAVPNLQFVAVSTDGRYVVVKNDKLFCEFHDAALKDEVVEAFNSKRRTFSSVQFGATDGGVCIVLDDGSLISRAIPSVLCSHLRNNKGSNGVPRCIALHPTKAESFLLLWEDGSVVSSPDCDRGLLTDLRSAATEAAVQSVFFGLGGSYVVNSARRAACSHQESAAIVRLPSSALESTCRFDLSSFCTSVLYDSGRSYVGCVASRFLHRHGPGVTHFEQHHPLVWFCGRHHNDSLLFGAALAQDGTQYQGEFSDGLFEGWGTRLSPCGTYFYAGQFRRGFPSGFGMFRDRAGDRLHLGWFENGKRNGECLVFFGKDNHRRIVQGSYVDNCTERKYQGLIEMTDGRVFRGNVETEKGSLTSHRTAEKILKQGLKPDADMVVLDWMGENAQIFIEESWPGSTDDLRVEYNFPWRRNKTMTTDSLQKFLKGMRLLFDILRTVMFDTELGLFGWYAPQDEAERQHILHHGFSEKHVSWKHAPGVRVYTFMRDAVERAPSTNATQRHALILCYILPGPHLNRIDSYCNVSCEPPQSCGTSFMFPIASVHFDASRVLCGEVERPSAQPIVRFHRLVDGNKTWLPYHDRISEELEFQRFNRPTKDQPLIVREPTNNGKGTVTHVVCFDRHTVTNEVNPDTNRSRLVRKEYTLATPTMRDVPPVPGRRIAPHEQDARYINRIKVQREKRREKRRQRERQQKRSHDGVEDSQLPKQRSRKCRDQEQRGGARHRSNQQHAVVNSNNQRHQHTAAVKKSFEYFEGGRPSN